MIAFILASYLLHTPLHTPSHTHPHTPRHCVRAYEGGARADAGFVHASAMVPMPPFLGGERIGGLHSPFALCGAGGVAR